jgi:hypothetical protein
MKGRSPVLILLLLLALGAVGYLVYEGQQNDIEIELPDVDVNGAA